MVYKWHFSCLIGGDSSSHQESTPAASGRELPSAGSTGHGMGQCRWGDRALDLVLGQCNYKWPKNTGGNWGCNLYKWPYKMVTGLITPVNGPTPTPPFRENMLFFSHPETTKSKLYGGGEWWWCMGGMVFFPAPQTTHVFC